jgi:LysR family transcriptional regulator, transcriptional activator of the cysJI operon
MHIENFKTFSDLVDTESFSRAAKLNGVTQSAVSQQLRAMEKHFDILIVDRSQKQFRLTREGQKLYEAGKEILYMYEKLNSELQEMRKIISGNVHISTIYSIGLHELPPYIKTFLQVFPAVNVRVEYRRANNVYEDILHNSTDLGIVAYPQKNKQLEIIPFAEDKMVLVVHPNHRLAGESKIELKELANEKIIGFESDIPTRKATDNAFRTLQIDNMPVMEFDNVETVKRAVEIDAGVAILPKATVLSEEKQGLLKIIPIKGDPIKRPLALLHRKGRVLTPALSKFIDLMTGKDISEIAADI